MLKLRVAVVGNSLLMQVVEWPTSRRGDGIIFQHNGWDIASEAVPCLDVQSKTLWLPGDRTDHDADIVECVVDDMEKALADLTNLVRAYNGHKEDVENGWILIY